VDVWNSKSNEIHEFYEEIVMDKPKWMLYLMYWRPGDTNAGDAKNSLDCLKSAGKEQQRFAEDGRRILAEIRLGSTAVAQDV
jgi:hypothetical protein